MIGVEERDYNGIHIVRLHYTADPAKRSAEWLAQASEGLSKRQVRRELEIDWTIASGLPVYSEDFQRDWHVAKSELAAVPHVPLLRGWDFGLTPACVVAQLTALGRLNILYPEFVTWTGRGEMRQQSITALAPVVIQQCALFFGQRAWRDWADPAGWAKAQTDERTCVQVMNGVNIHPVPGEVTFTGRRRGVESLLRRAIQGQAALQIDPRCTMLIEAFEGAYKFAEIGETGRYRLDVDKNAWSHPMNAFEYLASGIYGRQAEVRDEDEERERRKRKKALEGGY